PAALAEIPGCIAASGQVRFSTGRCRAGGAGSGAQPAGNGLRNRSPAVADAGGGRGLMASQVQARPSVAALPWGCASMRIRSADTGAMSGPVSPQHRENGLQKAWRELGWVEEKKGCRIPWSLAAIYAYKPGGRA